VASLCAIFPKFSNGKHSEPDELSLFTPTALGSTRVLTEMITQNLPGGGGGKGRPVVKKAHVIVICEPTV
jgi:hypothetical protein